MAYLHSFFIASILGLCLALSACQSTTDTQTTDTDTTDSTTQATAGFDLQGHRGTRGLLPENSIPAFLKALELGVNTLELDVVVSKDSQLVVSHEPWFNATICTDPQGKPLDSLAGTKLNIYQMTLADIQAYDCGSIQNPRFPEQQTQKAAKPTLREVVEAVKAYCEAQKRPLPLFNIETKSLPQGDDLYHPRPNRFAALLYAEIKALGLEEYAFVQSFDVRTLQAMRQLAPSLPLVLLVENQDGLDANLERLGFIPQVYSPYFKLLDASVVSLAQAKGMKVIPWTVNEPDDMRKMRQMGVDGLITDYPDRFLALD
ncbi:glycerophosphodiester phosphodiesterase [Eisenibacter elegans]|jgi:glycerophosphoryl diester phosphodiesterase|uniref:glycerophosphodiester phosphodiesterase n=1 Tax=Eisenibacter elegans TaxID=997 RepID=UPI0003FAE0DD|nr:glycerophosphodiester phosphodiesterase [Eisenibacter elegans]